MSSKVNWMPSCRDKMSFHGHLNTHYLHNVSFSRRTQTEVMFTCCNWHRYIFGMCNRLPCHVFCICMLTTNTYQKYKSVELVYSDLEHYLSAKGLRMVNPRLFWTSDIRYWKWILSGKFGTIVFIFGQYSLPNIYWTFLSSLHPGHY